MLAYQSMLTTVDNPFNPFEDYVNWLMFDLEKGYFCAELVDRFAETGNDKSDVENMIAIETAIDKIVLNDALDVYRKVTKPLEQPE